MNAFRITSSEPTYTISRLRNVEPSKPTICKCREGDARLHHPRVECPELKPDRDEADISSEVLTVTFEKLCEYVRNPDHLPPNLAHKGNLEAWAPGRYEGRRRGENLQGRDLVWIDSDCVTDIEEVVAWLRAQGTSAAIHTTYNSPNPDGTLRVRVIVPLSREVGVDEWNTKIKGWMRSMPGAVVDGNALDAVRFLYAPVRVAGYQSWIVDGAPLDVDALPADTTAPKRKERERDEPDEPIAFGDFDEKYRHVPGIVGAALALDHPGTGKRNETAAALAGALLMSKDVPAEQVPILTQECCRVAGFGTLENKKRYAGNTCEKVRKGEAVTGFTKLKALSPRAADALDRSFCLMEPGALVIDNGYDDDYVDAPTPSNDTKAPPKPVVRGYTFDPYASVRGTEIEKKKVRAKNTETGKLEWNEIDCQKQLKKGELGFLQNELHSNHVWANTFRLNEYDHKTYAFDPPFKMALEDGGVPESEDIQNVRTWFEVEHHKKYGDKDVATAMSGIAKKNCFHPIKKWLESLPTPTTHHLDRLAATLFGDVRPYAQLFLKKTLIASIARLYEPGCKVDTVLTLSGPNGGERKSDFIEQLYKVPCCRTYRSGLPDIANKQDIGEALDGYWVIELPELDATRKKDKECVKDFITRKEENFSPKYIRGEVTRPRACVFWASTNDEEFLPSYDSAFRRRWWTIQCDGKANLEWLDEHRKEVWAEALALYRSGRASGQKELWWFDDEAAVDAERTDTQEHPWAQQVASHLGKLQPLGCVATATTGTRGVTASEIWNMLQGPGTERLPTDSDLKRVSQAMTSLGFTRERKEVDGKTWRGWTLAFTKEQRVLPNGSPLDVWVQTRAAADDDDDDETCAETHLERAAG